MKLEPIQFPDSLLDPEENVEDIKLTSTLTEPNNTEPEPTNLEEPKDSDLETPTELDLVGSLLKEYGIEDGKTILYQNEDESTEEVDFSTLSKEEQLSVLKELISPGLTEDEINTINYLRKNNATMQDVAEYYKKKGVEEYISQNGEIEKHYSIDDYTEDELYLADLKERYPDMTDEELQTELETAKSNEDLFKKKVDIIKTQYKAREDKQAEDERLQEEQQYESFKNLLQEKLDNFKEVSLDYKDQESDALLIENSDKEKIFSYILNKDEDGLSQFFKDLNDPNVLIELAWYRLFGKDAISGISQYWKDQLKETRKVEKNPSKSVTTVVPSNTETKPTKEDKHIDTFYNSLLN